MRVILDQQHVGRTGRHAGDRGAVHGELVETDLTAAYIVHARDALRDLGHTVILLASGAYAARHREVVDIARDAPPETSLYVACHANAGGGRYSLVEYDARSARGKVAAACMAGAFATLPGVTQGRTLRLAEVDRGFACIGGIYDGPAWLTAVLVEPGFIDAPEHAALWTPEGLERVGHAIAAGCLRYAEGAL